MGVQSLPVMSSKAGRVGRGFALPTETTGRSFPVGNASALAHPTGTGAPDDISGLWSLYFVELY